MTDTISPYPLQWPLGVDRTAHPETHPKFNATIFAAERQVYRELELMGATQVVVTCNADRNRDGSIAARQTPIDDTGVAVHFRMGQDARVLSCDRWQRLEHNLRAIALMVNAIRGIERWGGRQMVDRTFAGLTALPSGGHPWHEVLGVAPTASRTEIEAAYKRLAKALHPDAGGTQEAFVQLQTAYQEARAA